MLHNCESGSSSTHRPRDRSGRVSVGTAKAIWCWQNGTSVPWSDVKLPHDCHLSPVRVPMPPTAMVVAHGSLTVTGGW